MNKYLKYTNLFYYLLPVGIFISILIFTDTKSSTDTIRFIQWANEMKINPLSALSYLFQERGIDGVMFYFSVLYFKISLILNDNFKYFFILLNSICFISIIHLIKKLSFKIKYYYLIPFFISINYDYIIWTNYLLTDFFFSFLCLLFILNLSLNNLKYINILLILLLVFTRPPGIVSVLIYLQYITFIKVLGNTISLKKNFFYLVIIYSVITILISFSLFYNVFPEIFYDTFQYHRSYYFEGVIINDRPHTYVEVPKNIFDIIKIILLRFISFFIFYDELFSIKHNILNFLVFIPLYLLSLYTLFKFSAYEIDQKKIIVTMIITIISFCFFHSILLIDYDWRYRVPCLIPISILAAMAFEKFNFSKQNLINQEG